jgi:hypothetical protein
VEPRPANDISEFGARNAVYAASDGIAALLPSEAYDLSRHDLKDLWLRDEAAGIAIRLGTSDFSLFAGATPGVKIVDWLRGEGDLDEASYAQKSLVAREWHDRYWMSPLAGLPFSPKVEPTSEGTWKAYNTWATNHYLRDDIDRLVERSFPSSYPTSIDLRGSPATTAVVTVEYRGATGHFLTLKYSRKECGDCPTGFSGWWLWAVEEHWICSKDKGFEKSSQPCDGKKPESEAAVGEIGRPKTSAVDSSKMELRLSDESAEDPPAEE